MRNHISYTVLGLALVAGASAANAQTDSVVIAQQPVAAAPVQTVETVRTVRSTTTSPRRSFASRHVVRSRAADRVTTTRTTVTERVVPAPAIVAPAPAAVVAPTYTEVVQGPVVAPSPAYPDRLYDLVTPAPVAPPPAVAPAAMFGAGATVPTYRYVYEPDRILVIDPYTNIAVQAIPR